MFLVKQQVKEWPKINNEATTKLPKC